RVAAFFCAACHASAAIVWNQFLLSFIHNPRQGSVCSFHERTARIRFRTTRGGSLCANRDRGEASGREGGGERRTIKNDDRSEEHTSELQSPYDLVCRLL